MKFHKSFTCNLLHQKIIDISLSAIIRASAYVIGNLHAGFLHIECVRLLHVVVGLHSCGCLKSYSNLHVHPCEALSL